MEAIGDRISDGRAGKEDLQETRNRRTIDGFRDIKLPGRRNERASKGKHSLEERGWW